MSKLDDLIKEKCPNGVKYLELGEICEITKGRGLSKSDKGTGNIPIILYGELYTTYGNYIDEVISFASESAKNSLPIAKNDLLLPVSSTTKEAQIGKASVYRLKNECYLGGDAIRLRHKQNSGFLMYIINSTTFEKQKMKCVSGTTINHLNPGKLAKIKVPVPPLEVQNEIVQILDNFAELTAELTAELSNRKRQYEYYRDLLLSFNENEERERVKWYCLGDIMNFKNGKGHEKSIVSNGKYVVVNSKFISTNGDVRKYSNSQIEPVGINDVLMVMSDLPNGKALAKCFLVDENYKYTLNQRICALHTVNNDIYKTKYLYYYLSRNRQLLRYDNGIDQTNLKKDDILKVKIPIPSTEEQDKIIHILDMFSSLTQSMSEGLPAEIEAREKQYAYYRDKLLSFEELVSNA